MFPYANIKITTMKLRGTWEELSIKLEDLVKQGSELHSKEREVKSDQDFQLKKEEFKSWDNTCTELLKNSFEENNNSFAKLFIYSGNNSFNIPGVNKDWQQLNKELFTTLHHKFSNLHYIKRMLEVSDLIVSPKMAGLIDRGNYTTQQIMDLILDKLFLLYDASMYPIPLILEANGVGLKRPSESREIINHLATNGFINTSHTMNQTAQLTLEGKMYIEEKRKVFKENYDDIDATQEMINKIVDEIKESLAGLMDGQEIIFEELEEIRDLYGKLSKKHWGQIVKGKLIDLGLSKLVENDTLTYMYDSLTKHVFRLP